MRIVPDEIAEFCILSDEEVDEEEHTKRNERNATVHHEERGHGCQ